jgi:hypothetical protein
MPPVAGPRRGWRSAARATLIAGVLAGGCAGLANTPAQEIAFQRWEACKERAALVELREIDRNGRISFLYLTGWDRQAMLHCLARVPPGQPPLPEPLALSQPRGL